MRFARNNIASPRGFTVVELLVVIGILVLLAGLITAMALRSRRSAERIRVESDLQGIATALEAYKQDFGDYPRLEEAVTPANPFELIPPPLPGNNPNAHDFRTGAELLCWALVAPYPATGSTNFDVGDGSQGPGFRVRGTRGLVYGPYLNIDTYKFGTNPQFPRYQYLKDYAGNPILYFAARNPRPTMATFAGRGKNFFYDFRDNEMAFYRQQNLSDSSEALQRFQLMVGDAGFEPAPTDRNGAIDGVEQAINGGPYLLWAAGPDEGYGPENPGDADLVRNEVKNSDDIMVPAN